jgi:hypothetical protein
LELIKNIFPHPLRQLSLADFFEPIVGADWPLWQSGNCREAFFLRMRGFILKDA